MSPFTAAITSSLPEEKQGVASALNDTVREMGGAVGIALISSVLNSAYRTNVEPTAAGLSPAVADPVTEGIGGALAVADQLGADGTALVRCRPRGLRRRHGPSAVPGGGSRSEPRLHPSDQTDSRIDGDRSI